MPGIRAFVMAILIQYNNNNNNNNNNGGIKRIARSASRRRRHLSHRPSYTLNCILIESARLVRFAGSVRLVEAGCVPEYCADAIYSLTGLTTACLQTAHHPTRKAQTYLSTRRLRRHATLLQYLAE
ncbi:hypothetical protein EJ03DRAFT_78114 [Teratosphaeria nubilosa]|uniref:Uncharacterized protein n=1 Tax=Teratosphaeria nubilosa TaxID=161662 RepID=A0A6G1LCG3_9PEZI|nr:hypothetical protein EJ03DRAFT_78114 [Teratosphaeria nubilosa]